MSIDLDDYLQAYQIAFSRCVRRPSAKMLLLMNALRDADKAEESRAAFYHYFNTSEHEGDVWIYLTEALQQKFPDDAKYFAFSEWHHAPQKFIQDLTPLMLNSNKQPRDWEALKAMLDFAASHADVFLSHSANYCSALSKLVGIGMNVIVCQIGINKATLKKLSCFLSFLDKISEEPLRNRPLKLLDEHFFLNNGCSNDKILAFILNHQSNRKISLNDLSDKEIKFIVEGFSGYIHQAHQVSEIFDVTNDKLATIYKRVYSTLSEELQDHFFDPPPPVVSVNNAPENTDIDEDDDLPPSPSLSTERRNPFLPSPNNRAAEENNNSTSTASFNHRMQ